MTPHLINLGAGLLLLYLGGEGMVRGSASLGLRLGMSPLLTGLTLVAFGTSAPELVVSLQAALAGKGGLAIGNVVGSNICNIALILGLSTLIRPVEVGARVVRHDVPILLASAVGLTLMLLDGRLARIEAALLLAGIAFFIFFTLRTARAPGQEVALESSEGESDDRHSWAVSGLLMVAGLGLLVWGGRVFVDAAIGVSLALGVAPAVIGLSVAAVGTSLPELATSIISAARGYGDMAAGNVIGSNIFNTFAVLGVAGSVTPLDAGALSLIDLAVMLLFSVVTLRLLASHAAMARWEGAALVTGFFAYMAWLFA